MPNRCSPRSLPHRAAVAFVTIALIPALPGFGQSAAPTDTSANELLPRIHSAWHNRTQHFQRFRIQYVQTRNVQSDLPPLRDAEIEGRAKAELPMAQTTVAELVMDGPRGRITERPGEDDSAWTGETDDERISVDDGRQRRGLSRSSRREYPQGVIAAPPVLNPKVSDHKALLLAFRPSELENRSPSLHNYRIVDLEAELDGRHVVRMEWSSPNDGKRRKELWVDPALDYAIVQLDSTVGGKLRSQYRIAYDQDAPVAIPAEWSYQLAAGNGDTSVGINAKRLKFEADPEISDATFELTFPPGTRYQDPQIGNRIVVDSNDQPGEFPSAQIARGATQIDLMEGEVVYAPPTPEGNRMLKRWFILFIANFGAMVVVYGVVVLFRRWHAR